MAFEENDFYRVEVFNVGDLEFFGNRHFYSDDVFVDAETAEKDGDLHGKVDPSIMNSVVFGILKGDLIVQVIRKQSPANLYASMMYANRAVHELWLIRHSRILAYFSSFDEQITRNLLRQASGREKANILLGRLDEKQFIDIKYGRMSKNKAMAHLGVNTPVPFEDGGLCPIYFSEYLKTGNEDYLEVICLRNQSCLIGEHDIVDAIKERGEWWLS